MRKAPFCRNGATEVAALDLLLLMHLKDAEEVAEFQELKARFAANGKFTRMGGLSGERVGEAAVAGTGSGAGCTGVARKALARAGTGCVARALAAARARPRARGPPSSRAT